MNAGSSGNGGWVTACVSLFLLGCFVGATAQRMMVAGDHTPSIVNDTIISGAPGPSDAGSPSMGTMLPEPPAPPSVVGASGTVQSITGDMVAVAAPNSTDKVMLHVTKHTTVGPGELHVGDKVDFKGIISDNPAVLEALSITRLAPGAVLKDARTPPKQ